MLVVAVRRSRSWGGLFGIGRVKSQRGSTREATPVCDIELLSPEQLCERVPGLTVESLKQSRYRGTGPPFMKPNMKTVVYDWCVYVAWLKAGETTKSSRRRR